MQHQMRTVFLFGSGLIFGFIINLFMYRINNLTVDYCETAKATEIVPLIKYTKKFTTEKNILYTRCNYTLQGPRILCAVFTHSKVHSTVHYVHNTWGKKCDKVIYMTGPKQPGQNDDPNFEFVYLNMTDNYERITEKALFTFEYIYDNLMEEFDWFVRANDDTYIIMENLKLFFANRCSDDMSIYGKVLKYRDNGHIYNAGDNRKGFLQGGTGFLISREALRLFVKAMRKDPKFCVMYKGRWEDQEISNCFRKINIYPGETRDELNRERFFMDQFHHLWESPSRDYSRYSLNEIKLGENCCSDTGIGFHNIKGAEHYKMDYFLYRLRQPINYTFVKV